jgi:hypothetical protein
MRILVALLAITSLAAGEAVDPPTRHDLFVCGQIVETQAKALFASAKAWERHCIAHKMPTTGCYGHDLTTAVYPPGDKGEGKPLNAELMAAYKAAEDSCHRYNQIHWQLHLSSGDGPALGITGESDQTMSAATLLRHQRERETK